MEYENTKRIQYGLLYMIVLILVLMEYENTYLEMLRNS